MVDNIRDLVDLWLIVGGMGVAIFTYGLGGIYLLRAAPLNHTPGA